MQNTFDEIVVLEQTMKNLEFIRDIIEEQEKRKAIILSRIYARNKFLINTWLFAKALAVIMEKNKITGVDLHEANLHRIYTLSNSNVHAYEDQELSEGFAQYAQATVSWLVNDEWEAIQVLPTDIRNQKILKEHIGSPEEFQYGDFQRFCLDIASIINPIFLLEHHPYRSKPQMEWEKRTVQDSHLTPAQQPTAVQEFTKLEDAFKDQAKYQRVMNILVRKDLCYQQNYKWLDTKEKLVGIIKHLDVLGYLHRSPTQKELITISSTTFHTEVSQRTCNTKPGDVRLPDIPLADSY